MDEYDTQIIMFDEQTGVVSISTSSSSYTLTTMDLMITCSSTESIHMGPLRTVTDTFSVTFVSDQTQTCLDDPTVYLFQMNPEVPYSNTYNIDGSNSEMYVQPYFVSYSPNCPAFCSLYEGHAFDLTTLSEASHPALTRFSHQTGQVVIATNENSFAGETLQLTIECVASRQYFGYFKVEFEVTFTIPNGCLISFDNSNSLIL